MPLFPANLTLLDLPQGPFPGSALKDVGLLVFPSLMLFCGAWTTDYHPPFLPSAALLWAAPYPTLSLWQEEGCTVSAEVGEKGTESTSHFYRLPITRAWQPWKVGQRDTMGLHFAEQDQSGCHTVCGTWLGTKQVSQNQHLVTDFSLVLLLLGITTLSYRSVSAIISVLTAKRQC